VAAASDEGGAVAGSSGNETSSGVDMLGRGDFMNRFNLFDNMSALPQKRVWGGYQILDKFQSGFGNAGNPDLPLTQHRTENVYRAGAECDLGSDVCLICQAEYVSSGGCTSNNDAWSNPIIMLKWAALNTPDTVVTPIIGYSPETSQSDGELHERATRFLPGVLFFQSLDATWFVQGGMGFNLATNNGASTLDFALSLAGWLYSDPSLSVSGRRTDPFERAGVPFITGFIPQLEILGKHVINNADRLPYDPEFYGQVVPYTGYQEGRNVVDMTFGGTLLMFNHVSLSMGYSLPITGAYVRKNEFLTYVNVLF